MSLRQLMREYSKASITIIAGIGLVIFGFIVGFVSIGLGVVVSYYLPSNSYTVSDTNSNNELFKWAVSIGAFGFICIVGGCSLIGGGCRLCFTSCGECFTQGCERFNYCGGACRCCAGKQVEEVNGLEWHETPLPDYSAYLKDAKKEVENATTIGC